MKTKHFAVAVVALLLSLVPTWILAATMSDLAGSWDVQVLEKLTVKKLGNQTDTSTGTLAITDPSDDFNAVFAYDDDDDASLLIFSGACALDSKGKKLTMSLEDIGKGNLKDRLATWIKEWAETKYSNTIVTIDPDLIVFQEPIVYKAAKISKKTNAPNKATIKIKGTVPAEITDDVGTDNVTAGFTYTVTIIFNQLNP